MENNLKNIYNKILSDKAENNVPTFGTLSNSQSDLSGDKIIIGTNAVEVPMNYAGSEMKKGVVYYDAMLDEKGNPKGWGNYMMKFPDPIRKKSIELSYMNNQFSEHIGCEIFKSCGIEVQETLLRRYEKENIDKVVVLCKDFTKENMPLIEMSSLVNADISSGYKKDLSIESVMQVIDNNVHIVDTDAVKEHFWDVFVIDALIGNTDRHYGNWGFLKKDGVDLELAPIYDCGSSLGALVSDDMKVALLENKEEFKNKEYNVTSALRNDGTKIFYHAIFANPPEELQRAITRMVPRINLEAIDNLINTTDYMTLVHRDYLKKSLSLRYEKILLPSYNKVIKLTELCEVTKKLDECNKLDRELIENLDKSIVINKMR